MHRVAFAELERCLDEALTHIDAGETVIVTREGRDVVRMEPILEHPLSAPLRVNNRGG